MIRILCGIIGSLLSIVGIVVMILPLPLSLILGIAIFAIGLMFLIPSTPAAASLVRGARRKVRIFDRAMSAATNRMPYTYRRVLRETEVNPDW